MDRRVKERLVGAAVLVAAAVILIPEMLSGPRRATNPSTVTARNGGDASVKTYTIDLSRTPGVGNGATISEAAPPPDRSPSAASAGAQERPPDRSPSAASAGAPERPPEEVTPRESDKPAASSAPLTEMPANAPQAVPESSAGAQERPPDRSPSAASAGAQERPPARTPTVSAREVPAPIASSAPVPTSRGWAVQLGSFASRATADRMASEITAQGQKAFVMPVKSSNSTLYRVRIGPFADRAAANEVLRDVKSRVANAAVVAHP